MPNIITPYRMDIQQGNFVTQDLVDKLQVGQTRDQVKFILGTPLLTDVFHAARWDYIFRSSKGWRDPEKHLLTVYFENDKLARWEADVPPPKVDTPESLAKAQAEAEEKPGLFGRLFSSGKKSPTPAAATPSASVGGAANLASASAEPAPPPPPPPPAAPSAIASENPADKPAEQKPGVMSRLFGWMKFSGGTAEASSSAARAASPDPEPQPLAKPAPLPPAAPPAAQPMTAPSASATATPAEPSPVAPAPAAPPVLAASAAPSAATAVPALAPAPQAGSAVWNEILGTIEQWRSAWQAKDADKYLAAYAPDFKPAGGLSRAKWEAQRRERLVAPSFIKVGVVNPKVAVGKGDAAMAIFVQQYESDLLKESGRKTLKLGLYGGKWLIREESVVVTGATAPALAPMVAAPGAPQ